MILQIRLVTLFTFLMLMVLGVLFRSTLLPEVKQIAVRWLEIPSNPSSSTVQPEKATAHSEPPASDLPADRSLSSAENKEAQAGEEGERRETEKSQRVPETTMARSTFEQSPAARDSLSLAEGRHTEETTVLAPLKESRSFRDITRGEIDTILKKRREAEAILDSVHRETGWQ